MNQARKVIKNNIWAQRNTNSVMNVLYEKYIFVKEVLTQDLASDKYSDLSCSWQSELICVVSSLFTLCMLVGVTLFMSMHLAVNSIPLFTLE